MIKMTLFIVAMGIGQISWGQGAVISFGGGDLAAKFYVVANGLSRRISNVPQFLLPQSDLYTRIQHMLLSINTEVSEKPLIWEGAEVLAINYPNETPKRLVLSYYKWNQIEAQSPEMLDRLVLHELLPMLGLLDRNYENSKKILRVISDWKSWDSTDYFIKRYIEDGDFLYLWAEKSKDYYSNWGTDSDQLLVWFAYHVFPIRNSDSNYWVEIFKNYLSQYSIDVCRNEIFVVMSNSIKSRGQKVDYDVNAYIKIWFENRCKSVAGALTIK